MASKQGHANLERVQHEIELTLQEAEQALESFVISENDLSKLEVCYDCVHQVTGILNILELFSAECLALEVEKLIRAVCHKHIQINPDRLQLMMQGILQLPDYLDWIRAHDHEQPHTVLPLINRLRSARNETPLLEGALYNPPNFQELSKLYQAGSQPEINISSDLIDKIHQLYQYSLARIVNQEDVFQNLEKLHTLLLRLDKLSVGMPVSMVWQSGLAFLEVLLQRPDQLNKSDTILLMQMGDFLHGYVKTDVEEPEELPQTFLRSLLFVVACSNVEGEWVQFIKTHYHLSDEAAIESHLDRESELDELDHNKGYWGPDKRALMALTSALKEELLHIQSGLDLYVRSGFQDVSHLKTVIPYLTKVSAAFGMLELDLLAAAMTRHAQALSADVDDKSEHNEESLKDISQDLLWADMILQHLRTRDLSSVRQLQDSLKQNIQAAKQQLINACLEELIFTKEAITSLVNGVLDEDEQQALLESLKGVFHNLRMAELRLCAAIVEQCYHFFGREISQVGTEELSYIIEIVSNVEYYLELWPNTIDDEMALSRAIACAEQLGWSTELTVFMPPVLEELSSFEETGELIEVNELDDNTELEPSESVVVEASNESDLPLPDVDYAEPSLELLALTADEAASSGDELEPSDSASESSIESIELSSGASELIESDEEVSIVKDDICVTEKIPVDQDKAEKIESDEVLEEKETDELVDEEVLETFIEEVQEVLELMEGCFSEWQLKIDDTVALKELRRGFHTLKGSGRMVGANVIGNFAWAVEGLINRAIDRTLPISSEMVKLVGQSIEAVLSLLEDFVQGNPANQTYIQLEESVIELAQTGLVRLESKPTELPASSTVLDAEDVKPLEHDEGLLAVFIQEARGHLQRILEITQTADESLVKPNQVSFILHTLKGSAYMAKVMGLLPILVPLERFIKRYGFEFEVLSPDIVSYLQSCVPPFQAYIAELSDEPELTFDDEADLLEKLAVLVKNYLGIESLDALVSAKETPSVSSKLASIFSFNSMNVVLEADVALQKWQSHPDVFPQELLRLSDALSELLVLTKQASLDALSYMCELLVGIYGYYKTSQDLPDSVLLDLLNQSHHHLIEAVDVLAQGEQCIIDEALLERLEQIDIMPPEVSSGFSEEYDPELIEIFSSEAADIIESNGVLLAKWLQHPSDKLVAKELQRDFHTLKGGARMSGIEPFGELAQCLEKLCEAYVDGRFVVNNGFFRLLYACHNQFDVMLQSLLVRIPLNSVDHLVAMVETFLSSGVIDDPSLPILPDMPEDTQQHSVVEQVDADHSSLLLDDEKAYSEEKVENTELLSTSLDMNSDVLIEVSNENVLSISDLSDEIKEDIEFMSREEFDDTIFEIFMEEAEELNEQYEEVIAVWRQDSSSEDKQEEIKRILHTLKGSARLCGMFQIGNIAHDLESYLDYQAVDVEKNADFFNELQDKYDQISHHLQMLKKAFHNELETGHDALESPSVVQLNDARELLTPDSSMVQEEIQSVSVDQAQLKMAMHGLALPPESTEGHLTDSAKPDKTKRKSGDSGSRQQEMVKVKGGLLEKLVNLVGETSIASGRVGGQVSQFKKTMDEMSNTIFRMRDLIRRLDIESEAQMMHRHERHLFGHDDFDPLEMDRYSALHQLSRSLAETASDILDFKDTFTNNVRDTESLIMEQMRINTELQEGLKQTQLVPFSRMLPRLKRIVRQISTELDKKVELEVINSEGEMDRTVLERLVAPLEHMLRNAVDHGIELPEERIRAGKKEVGRVLLHLTRERGDIVLRLSDDGQGLHLDSIKKKAIDQGIMNEKAVLTDNEMMQFIFKPGFSTAKKVTQISGRGVGMDVVYSEIKQLGGSLKIHSAEGAGSQFTIRLPFTVSVNRALMVRVADDAYAIPLINIEGIVRVSPHELKNYYKPDAPKFGYAGKQYRMQYLGFYVHGKLAPDLKGRQKPLPVLLIRSGDDAIALQVDTLVGSREVVVKGLGAQLSAVSGISGATILGDGSVVIILDLMALLQAEHAIGGSDSLFYDGLAEPDQTVPTHRDTPLIMVVDDSVTVRKVTSRLLERKGMDVIVAKDGVDAMTQLQEVTPDLMLLDIEMPRMDGFEVASQCRHNARLSEMPIIMITSRTGEKHRQRAESLGVKGYMGKPYQETLLLEMIEKMLNVEAIRT